MLDFIDLVSKISTEREYSKRITSLKLQGKETQNIEKTVHESVENIKAGRNSFIIYGEPQSGKTELMIALSAHLVDEGYKIIIILLNDDVELLNQNLQRFRDSSISPTPVNYSEIIDEAIGTRTWIIFCKKNRADLTKLNSLLDKIKDKIIIDDEADYASPNARINLDEKTKINSEIERLLQYNGIYIGVTATPARLDLNNTFSNITEHWIKFEPHSSYAGKDIFFPIHINDKNLRYKLIRLPDEGDKPEFIQDALRNFIVNVSILNLRNNEECKKYSFLIHTSGQINDHSKDRKDVNTLMEALCDKQNKKHEYHWNKIIEIISAKCENVVEQELVFKYAYKNISNKYVAVLNSDLNKNRGTDVNATDPPAIFSIFIGGNKVSRGITFGNLLGMFFTRDTKHKLQQDTYIQRARMFGNRLPYIEFFELWIPKNLYNDWHRCFVYHYLSLKSIESNGSAPVWIGDNRIRPVSSTSIDNKTLVLDKGEMAFSKFRFIKEIEANMTCTDNLRLLENINSILGDEAFPGYVLDFIKLNCKKPNKDIHINDIRTVESTEDKAYVYDLYRKRGTFGGRDIDENALHNILILRNEEGFGRVLYYYSGNVEFFKKQR
jgi:hypothetical protein